jgi:serine protease Do
MMLSPLTPDNRRKYKVRPEIKNGVMILRVQAGSKAAERGLQAGDVIVEIAQQEVNNPADVIAAAKAAKAKNKPLLLLVARDEDARFVALPVNDLGKTDSGKNDADKKSPPAELDDKPDLQ